MKITVDRDRCEGYGFCEQAASAVLRLDDEGYPQILVSELPAGEVSAAEAATRVCPVAALTILAS